jgi:hypothetical protein
MSSVLFEKTVGGQIDPPDLIVLVKHLQDFRQIFAHERLSARKPQVRDEGHRFRNLSDLQQGEIPSLVQLLPIKTVPTLLITNRGNKEDDGI